MKFNFNGFVVFLRRFFAGTDWESLAILLFILANEVETGDFDQPMDNFSPHVGCFIQMALFVTPIFTAILGKLRPFLVFFFPNPQ